MGDYHFMSNLSMFKKIVSKQLGAEIFSTEIVRARLGTSSLKLDDFIGGGIVEGRLIEIYGGESSGKTTLSTLIAINAQHEKPDLAVGIIDLEHVFNWEYSGQDGYGLDCNEEKLVFSQPNSGEDALALAEKMLESGLFSVVIVDSVAAMLTKRQLSGDIGDATIGEVARLMSATLPKLNKAANATNTTLVFINQTRDAVNTFSPHGTPTTTPGGKALKFYCSLRVEVKKREFIVQGDKNIGQEIRCTIRKNKFGRNSGYVDLSLFYNIGFKKEAEIVDLAIQSGIIEARGAWIYYGENKWNGRKVLTEAINNDENLFKSIYDAYKLSVEDKNNQKVSIEILSNEEVLDDDE